MNENPYKAPESEPEIDEASEEESGLSWRDVWDALSGWGSLLILVALIDALSVWAAGSRTRLIIFVSGMGILVVTAVLWYLRRTR